MLVFITVSSPVSLALQQNNQLMSFGCIFPNDGSFPEQARYTPRGGGGGGVLPYMGYIGMCGPKGYGFSAVLVINRVSIIAILPPLWS